MMAGIRFSDFGEAIKCGAVIIDRKYVLTAAHCVENKKLDELTVVVGEHNVTTDGESSLSTILFFDKLW